MNTHVTFVVPQRPLRFTRNQANGLYNAKITVEMDPLMDNEVFGAMLSERWHNGPSEVIVKGTFADDFAVLLR